MIYSQPDPAQLAAFLADHGLRAPGPLRGLAGGQANTIGSIETDAGPRVLKIWEQKSARQVAQVAGWTLHAARHGVPVAAPLADRAGRHHQVRAGRVWELLPLIPGRWVEPAEHAAAGAALARLHAVPPPSDLPTAFTMGEEAIRSVIHRVREDRALGARLGREGVLGFLTLAEQTLAELAPVIAALPSLPQSVCHGDLWADNVLVDGGEVSALLDLEECFLGARALDVAMAMLGCGDGVLDGVPSLTARERGLLPGLKRYCALGIGMWRYERFEIQRADEALRGRYRAVLPEILGG